MTQASADEVRTLRERAFITMGEVERAKAAVEVGRQFSIQLGPLVSSHEADQAVKTLREALAEELQDALHFAQLASQAYCEATRGSWIGKTVRVHRAGQPDRTLTVAGVLWGNWQRGEDMPSFWLLESVNRLTVPSEDTPCLGAAVWDVQPA